MNSDKWLKRRYPKSYDKVREFLNDDELKEFKDYRRTRKVGILNDGVGEYKKGDIFMYEHQKDCDEEGWTGGFRYYCIFKCQEGYTQSGYHSFLTWNKLDFEEIKR